MPAPALRLLLLPLAALGDEAALGVWARQIPQLLSRSLAGSVATVAPLWRDTGTGRLIRPGGALPQSVVRGEAEAAAADWVLTGAVAQTDEGLRADLCLHAMHDPDAAQAWCLPFAHGGEGAAFAVLVGQIAARLALPEPLPEPLAAEPLWPLLCDLEVESELTAAGTAGLAKPAFAWSHLRAAASSPAPAWVDRRLAERRLLLQRIAAELLPAFDGAGAGAAHPAHDLSTDEVLLLLGISSTATPPPRTDDTAAMKNLRLTPLLLLLMTLSLSGCSLIASPGPMTVKTGTESMDSILPDPHESPSDLAARAEQAFAQGQFRSAQEQFGRLFVLQPDFRGTLAIDGLRGTCQQLGDDCRLIFAKYQFLGDVFRGAFGSRAVWPSQQEADFRSIIQCYNLATMGRFKEAIDVGARTTVAPLPGFAQAALVCVSTSDEIYKRVAEEQARGAARQRWKAEIAAFGVQFDGISSAVAAQDWEQVITLETAYNGRADALQTMAADGTVARASGEADFAEASSDIAELKRTLSRQKKQLDETRRALAALQSNPAYLDAAAQFANLFMTEGDQAGQVATLERTLAANQQPGPAQMQLTMQLEAARDRLRETRRNLRDILIRTNDLRKNLKLVPRDRP